MIESVRHLWSYLSGRRRLQLMLLTVMVLFTSFAEILTLGAVLPFLAVLAEPEKIFHHSFVQPVVQVMEVSEPGQLLFPLTVFFLLAAVLAGAMRLTLLWAQARYSSAIGTDLSGALFQRVLDQPYSAHIARDSADVISTISSKTTIVVFQTLFPLLVVFSSLIVLVGIVGFLLILEPWVALSAILGFASIYAVLVMSTKNRMLLYGEQVNREQSKVIRALQEGLGGIRNILIDGTQSTFFEIYRRSDSSLRRAQANMLIIGNGPRFVVEVIAMIFIAVLAIAFSEQKEGISSIIPVLGVFALATQRLLPSMQQAYSGWTAIRGSCAALRDVLDLLDQPSSVHSYQSCEAPILFSCSIKINNLGFRYSHSKPWILRDLNLEIPKGGRVGLVGKSASGKSTLADLIMGLLPPTEGYLSVDGVPVTTSNSRAWWARIAHVPQSVFLTNASVAENIAFGVAPDMIDHARVRYAAELARISEAINSWEAGYESLVGERGVCLSGGQRQRIGIARAIYKHADVIVFDEATSALDNETECAVMESIESLSKDVTIIIVAHRLSTLKNCTEVFELENGQVKQSSLLGGMARKSQP